jgi:hypothetical protein
LEQKNIDLQNQFSQQLKMAEAVVSQVREKINAAENDAADFLAEYILFTRTGIASDDKADSNITWGRGDN